MFERLYPEREWTGGLFQPSAGDLRFLGWQQAPLRLSVRLVNDPAPARLGVRQFRFPGWRAWMDGKRIPVEVAPYVPQQQAGLGFIVLTVPPGEHTLNLALGPTPWRVAGMALAGLAGLAWRERCSAPGGHASPSRPRWPCWGPASWSCSCWATAPGAPCAPPSAGLPSPGPAGASPWTGYSARRPRPQGAGPCWSTPRSCAQRAGARLVAAGPAWAPSSSWTCAI